MRRPEQVIGLVLSSVPAYSETFFTTKINGLTQHGFRIFLFARGRKKPDLHCKVVQPYPVYTNTLLRLLCAGVVLPIVFIRSPKACWRFFKLEQSNGSTLLQCIIRIYINAHILPYKLNWLHFGFAAVSVGRENVAKAIQSKMAVSLRGYDINVYPLKNQRCYTKLWQNIDKVHSISSDLFLRARVLGLSGSTPVQIITPAVSKNISAKTNFRLGQPVKIVTVARLTWIKGLTVGLQAMAKLVKAGIQFHYTIIGEGPDHEFLVHEIHALELTDHVTLTGKLPHSKTLSFMLDSDIYLQPSLNEGFCNAVLEAQAMGCLCIASRAGGLVENIDNEITGWLVEPRNPVMLAEEIIRIIQLPHEKKISVSTQARQRVASHFQIDKHLLQWKSFYES